MRSCRLALAVLIAATTAAFVSAHAAPRSESLPYAGDAVVTLPNICITGPILALGLDGTTGACFDVMDGETIASVRFVDVTGLPVGGEVIFTDGGSNLLGETLFCDSTTLAIPPNTFSMYVYPDAVAGPVECFDRKAPGIGTVGHIDATFA